MNSEKNGEPDSYTADFHLIDNNIIYAVIKGYSTPATTKAYIEYLKKIISDNFQDGLGFSIIENYEQHTGASITAKTMYINFIRQLDGLRHFVFHDVRPFFEILIKIAKRLNQNRHFTVDICGKYNEAILLLSKLNKQDQAHFKPADYEIKACDWQNVQLSNCYSASFAVLDESIFISTPIGKADREGIASFMKERESFLKTHEMWNKPHVEIKDYYYIVGRPSRAGRNQFTKAIISEHERGMLKGIVYINTNAIVSLMIKLGTRLYGNGFPFIRATSLSDAINKAKTFLHSTNLDEPYGDACKPLPQWKKEGWQYKTAEFNMSCSVLGSDILFAEANGTPVSSDIPHIVSIFETVIQSINSLFNSHFRILNWCKLEQPGIKFLRDYSLAFKQLNSRLPSQCTIIYGASASLKTIIKFYAPFSSSRIIIAKDKNEALRIINEMRNSALPLNMLPVESDKEWNYISDSLSILQAFYGENILLQRIYGRITADDILKVKEIDSAALLTLRNRSRFQCFKICDISLKCRKKFLLRMKLFHALISYRGLRLTILYGTSLFDKLILFIFKPTVINKIRFARSIPEAYTIIEQKRQNDIDNLTNAPIFSSNQGHLTENEEWNYASDHFTCRITIINDNTLYIHGIGFSSSEILHIVLAKIKNVINHIRNTQSELTTVINIDEWIFISNNSTALFLREIARKQQVNGFYSIYHICSDSARKIILKLFLIINGIRVQPISSLRKLLTTQKTTQKKPAISSNTQQNSQRDRDINNLLNFIGSINWESDGIGNIVHPISNDNPLKPVYDAIALVKQDFDTLITEKDTAEKAIALENRLNQLRAEIWKVSINDLDEPSDLAISIVKLLRGPLNACRCAYMQLHTDDAGDRFICLAEDRDDTMPPPFR